MIKIGSEMTLREACDIVEQLASDRGDGIIETLTYMRENLHEFEYNEKLAFILFMKAGQRLFAPAE